MEFTIAIITAFFCQFRRFADSGNPTSSLALCLSAQYPSAQIFIGTHSTDTPAGKFRKLGDIGESYTTADITDLHCAMRAQLPTIATRRKPYPVFVPYGFNFTSDGMN